MLHVISFIINALQLVSHDAYRVKLLVSNGTVMPAFYHCLFLSINSSLQFSLHIQLMITHIIFLYFIYSTIFSSHCLSLSCWPIIVTSYCNSTNISNSNSTSLFTCLFNTCPPSSTSFSVHPHKEPPPAKIIPITQQFTPVPQQYGLPLFLLYCHNHPHSASPLHHPIRTIYRTN